MISCVIAVSNIRTGFRKAITDVTFPIIAKLTNCEVIVSDYNSNDGTKEFVESFGFKYVFTKPNKGEKLNVAKALNKSITHASTEYIHPVSPDVIYSVNICKIIEESFPKRFENSVIRYCLHHINKNYRINSRGGKQYGIHGYMYCFKKDRVLAIRGYDERLTCHREDRDFNHRYFQRHKPRVIRPENIVALHMDHPRHVGLMAGMDVGFAVQLCKANLRNKGAKTVNSFW